MIKYSLHCDNKHSFESWFQSSSAYDSQRKRKLVTCPYCDSHNVEKAIMAPQLARTRKSSSPAVPSEAAAQQDTPAPLMMAQEAELRAKLRELRDHLVKTADNVGEKFPTEARKMHYGDIEHRAIFGKASAEEARELVEEGIDVTPLPFLPDDNN